MSAQFMRRSIRISVRLTEEEHRLLKEKMARIGVTNQEAFLRKMALDGLVIRLDLPELKQMISLLRYTSNNINQIAKRLNESGRLELSEETAQLIEKSIELTKKYDGADISAGALTALWNVTGEEPRVPEQSEIQTALSAVGYENIKISGNECVLENGTQIDVGCDGKGFALDEVKKLLDSEKADCAVVSFGSSTLLYGQKPDKTDFKVAVTDPFDNDNTCLSFTSGGGFVSTSGGYERYFEENGVTYHHIIDPKTGYPSDSDLTSVTIVCADGTKADALSTSFFVMGLQKAESFYENTDLDFDVILLTKDNQIYISEGIAQNFTSDYTVNVLKK